MNKDNFVTVFGEYSKNSVALDDTIMVKDRITAAGSKILENFKSPFDAAVVTRLEAAGITIAGKTKTNEFGIGSITKDLPEEICGTVRCVAEGDCGLAFANDFFGTLRREAPESGVYYIHPAYGTVSRFGLIAAVSSMDQIGVVCKDITEGFKALSVIAGHDKNDGTTYPQKQYEFALCSGEYKIGIPVNVLNSVSSENAAAVREFACDFNTGEFELSYFDIMPQVFYILACAEISNNINRFDGIKFGYRTEKFSGVNDLYLNTRTEGLGLNTKLAAIMGCMVLSKEHYDSLYHKSMQIRGLIKRELIKLLSEYDAIILPSAMGKDADLYRQQALYAAASLCGLPSVSVPFDGKGIQLITKPGNENILFSLCKAGVK